MHHLKPYRQRVLGAYSFMEAALRAVAEQRDELRSSISADRQRRPESLAVRWERDEEPMETLSFTGVAYENHRSEVTGTTEVRYLGRTEQWELPVMGQHPVQFVTIPRAWWIPPAETEAIDLLGLHGIEFERMSAAKTLEVDTMQA
jgi:hypothetical protein